MINDAINIRYIYKNHHDSQKTAPFSEPGSARLSATPWCWVENPCHVTGRGPQEILANFAWLPHQG